MNFFIYEISAYDKLGEMPGLEIKCRHKIQGALHYCRTFTCVLMAALWFKILTAIDNTNKVIQARNSTIGVEVDNIDGL